MSEETRALVPIEERTVDFYGDEIKGGIVIDPPLDKGIYVPIRPLADFLGIDWRAQRARIQRDLVLSAEMRMVVLETAGGPQEMMCLPLDMLNGWLFGVNARRVKEEVRERLVRYQRECYRVLAEAFQGPAPVAQHPLAQLAAQWRAMAHLAEEQMELDRRLGTTEEELADVKTRVIALEDRVRPGEPITDEQAAHISQAVRSIAYKLSERSGRNEYGGVYSELYRRFGITSYKLLPAARFDEALSFLTDWWRQVSGTDEIPF